MRQLEWQLENDTLLKKQKIKYVAQPLQMKEILDFLQKDFLMNAWSCRRLNRRMFFLDI